MARHTNNEDIACDDCSAPVSVELTDYDDVIASCNQCGATEVYPPKPEDSDSDDDIPF